MQVDTQAYTNDQNTLFVLCLLFVKREPFISAVNKNSKHNISYAIVYWFSKQTIDAFTDFRLISLFITLTYAAYVKERERCVSASVQVSIQTNKHTHKHKHAHEPEYAQTHSNAHNITYMQIKMQVYKQ